MSTYDTVKTWDKEPLKACSIDIVCCNEKDRLIGFDLRTCTL